MEWFVGHIIVISTSYLYLRRVLVFQVTRAEEINT